MDFHGDLCGDLCGDLYVEIWGLEDLSIWGPQTILMTSLAGIARNTDQILCRIKGCDGSTWLHMAQEFLGIPRKTYFYYFFWIFGTILIKYLGFWSK